jgi:site-specific recombinase XerD
VRALPADCLDSASFAAWSDLEDALRAKQARPLTIENYGWALVQLYRHAGKPLLALEHHDICGYLDWLGAEQFSRSTIDTRYRALRRFYRYVCDPDVGYLAANPMRKIPAPQPDEKIIPVVSDDDVKALLRACAGPAHDERRDTAIIRLALTPGAPRAAELCGITLADLDLRAGVVLIRRGKWARDRLVPVGPLARQALNRYLAVRAQHKDAARPELFLGKYGPLTRSGVAQMLRRRCRQAGIAGIHPHMLRHTSAIGFRRAGGHAADAKKLYGWKSDKMVERYGAAAAGALAVEHGLAAAEQMEIRQ